jgi:hypothetical protein
MNPLINHPAILFVVMLVVMSSATALGALVLRRIRPLLPKSRTTSASSRAPR